ncbi:MAG: InlB B-repeat-containing protein, partial [Clostridia bacterium]|nr:InlB B-repeat-containing protein [Clostridia bacterium]
GSRGNAGIGGDIDHASGEIIIKGGVITATGGTDAAGIGGGQEENSGYGPITIYGGVIEAIAGSCAAGIGGGQENPNNKAGTITIYGGTVHARGGKSDLLDMNGGGAGIGSGEFQKSGMICIYGGTIRAEVEKSSEGAAIGSGGGDIKHPADAGPIYIYGGDVEALASFHGAAIGGGSLGGITLVRIEGGRVIAGTISTPNDHTLYGGAGIGGGTGAAQGGTVEITGGYVEAHSQYGAGIGGGGLYGKDGGEVIIKGGEVYATSCYAAGIGGGGGRQAGSNKQGNGGTVTITGGYVFAASEAVGAGIGGGATDDGTGVGGNGGTLTVEGGYVVSTSGSFSYDWVNYVSTDVPGEAAEGFAAALGALLGKLIFSDPEDVSSGAIGGGFKGNGGALIVRGGVVISNAGVGGKAVGGGSKSSSDGTISLPDNYAVKAGTNNNDAEYVNYDARTESCRTHIYVEIRRCPHVNAVYTDITDTHHTFTCPNCGASQVTETHEYDDVNDHDCNRCGHERVFMTFDPGDGTGYMSRRVVGKGSKFTLPACVFTAPAGAVFAGWSCTVDGEVRVYPAGKKLNPGTDIKFTAKWTADNRYNLWVSGVRVDSENKDDILGDGSAAYDPDTFTLTLDSPSFDNVHEGALIYADGFDLTVTGTAVFAGPAFGYAIYVKAGALTVGGDLKTAQTATVNALYAEYDVTVSNGTITVNGGSHGILAGGDLIIRAESVRVEANGNRSFGYRQITIEEGLVVTEYTYATRILPADIEPARVNHIVLEHGNVIIYELNGGTLNGQSGRVRRTVDVDGSVVRPDSDPVRDGFTFVGWFADQGLTLEFDFEQRVTEDTTVYAKWTKAFTVSIEWQTAGDDEPLPETVSAVLQHRENGGWRTVQTLALNAEGGWRGTFTYVAAPNDGAGDLFRIRELDKDRIVVLDRDDEYYASDVPSVILTVNGADTGYLVSYDRDENGTHTKITNQSSKVYSVELGWDIDRWDQDRIDEMEVVLQRRVNIFDWEVLQILTVNPANNWSGEFEPVPVGTVNQTTGTFVQYKYRVRLLEPDDEEEEENPQPQDEEQELQDAKERVIYDWLDLDKPFIKNMIELADPENLWTADDTTDWVNLQAKTIFIPRSQFVAEIDEYTDGIGKRIEEHETQYDVKYSHDSGTHKTSITNTAVFDVSIFKRWINFEEDDMPDSVWLMLVSKVQEDYAEQLGLSEYNIYTPVATVVYGDQINLLSLPGGEDGVLNDAIKNGLKQLLGDGLILNTVASTVIKTVIQKYTNTGIAIAEVDDEGSNPLTDWWTWMGVKKYGAFGVPMDFAGTELVTGFMEIVIDAIIKALGIPKIHCPVMYDPINECWSIKGYALSLLHDYELTCNVINIKFHSDDAPTSISGKKTWEGDTEDDRPSEIKIHVYAKGDDGSRTEITGSPVTVTAENDWSWSLDIPLNDVAVVTEDGENSSVE